MIVRIEITQGDTKEERRIDIPDDVNEGITPYMVYLYLIGALSQGFKGVKP